MQRKLAPTVLGGLLISLSARATVTPKTVDLHLANQYLSDGRYDTALSMYDELVRQNPMNAAAWNNRAIARVRLGQAVAAVGDYTRAIDLSPRDPELYTNRGDAY